MCEADSASKLFSESDIATLGCGEIYILDKTQDFNVYCRVLVHAICQAYFPIHTLHGHFEMLKFIKRLQVVSISQRTIPYGNMSQKRDAFSSSNNLKDVIRINA